MTAKPPNFIAAFTYARGMLAPASPTVDLFMGTLERELDAIPSPIDQHEVLAAAWQVLTATAYLMHSAVPNAPAIGRAQNTLHAVLHAMDKFYSTPHAAKPPVRSPGPGIRHNFTPRS